VSTPLRAQLDPRLGVQILSRKPLHYRGGADLTLDRPAHVRASSALCWVGSDLLVLQDDAAFLGIVDPQTGWVDDLPLPRGPDGHRVFDAARGNKADKPDFELAFADGDRLIAMGSGGLFARQQALTWRRAETPQLTALPRLYAQLRAAVVGSANLNFEGSALLGGQLILANRGGDAGSADALVELSREGFCALLDDPERAPLPLLRVLTVELGELAREGQPGQALRFTDLAPRAGGLWYLAAAERTTSFYDDGEVVGSVLGTIGGLDPSPELRFAPILNQHGALASDKVEGVCGHQNTGRLWAVTDPDDPDRPGELLELSLTGPWEP
jgi:hypothetical protein